MNKKTCPLIGLLLLAISLCYAQRDDDSIKLARRVFIKSQTLKTDSLNDVALKLAVPNASHQHLNDAIDNTMAALHIYSKFRDSTGLRKSFDNLALVYHLQQKYTQAKWFILQSNSLSRIKNDTINIIKSLIYLAEIKEDIKDFSLAKRDLNEALALAKKSPAIDEQIEVQKAIVTYYNKKGDIPDAKISLNKIAYLRDSVFKASVHQLNRTQPAQLQHTTPLPVTRESTIYQSKTIIITALILALLAVIYTLFYVRNKKRQ